MSSVLEKSKWRILTFEECNPAYNMAVDEAIYKLFPHFQIKTLRFYGWKPSAVSIGHHQDLNHEVDLQSLERYNFELVRRITGGGAVFHDSEGELTYSVVTDKSEIISNSIEDSYYEIVERVFEPLINLGVSIDYDQVHCPSVFSNGKKISGNAQARSGGIILQHGTILVDYRPEIMYSVLKARPGRTQSDMVASVYSKITTISQQINREISIHELAKYIINELLEKYPQIFYIGSLNKDEMNLAKRITKTRYQNSGWLNEGKMREEDV
ncbi:MAG: lipoate--protein ligase family protein [Candidatus Kariarchaeaceae archaeon]|jgi:lipoate-protein ligase A